VINRILRFFGLCKVLARSPFIGVRGSVPLSDLHTRVTQCFLGVKELSCQEKRAEVKAGPPATGYHPPQVGMQSLVAELPNKKG